MSDNRQSIYASTPFKFVVDGNPYYLHADLASHHSNPLDCLINGPMAEAQKGYAVLKDVDEGTFKRFIEWSYKGYYTAADFELEASIHSSPVPSNKEDCEVTEWAQESPADALAAEEPIDKEQSAMNPRTDWGMGISQKGKKSKKAKTSQELKVAFLHRKYTVRREVISIPPARANRVNEDYTEVFLSHARLYVFAEKYDIQPLKTLALEELHNTLAIYTLYRERTGDIVALLRYVYANTRVPARGSEDLQKLLRDYVGYEMSVLIKDEEFNVLMVEDGGPLLHDFMKMVAKRIS